jgi:hypothetical protein
MMKWMWELLFPNGSGCEVGSTDVLMPSATGIGTP